MEERHGQPHVRIRGVSKRFGSVHALSDVTLDIPRGSFTTFLGPSGCGKTTLLRTIAGFYEPDAGTIGIGDRCVNGVPSHLRGAVMVFQDYALFPHLSAADNIAYGLKVKRLPGSEIARRVERIADFLSVGPLLSRRPGQLSGGQQQRIALARALVMEPEVLLLDEPLSNLDAKLRESIRAELRRMQKTLGITTIYVTHAQVEALSLSDLVVVMNHGKVVQAASPREVYFSPVNRFVASFVGMANLIEARVVDASPTAITCDAGGILIRAAGHVVPATGALAPGAAGAGTPGAPGAAGHGGPAAGALAPGAAGVLTPGAAGAGTPGALASRAAGSPGALAPGTPVVLSLRPEHLHIEAAGPATLADGTDADPPDNGTCTSLPGVVASSLFEGSRVRYWVRAGNHELVVDEYERGEILENGAAVRVSFARDAAHLMREDGDG
ncbi:MAG TPA: ABC transporter ATP-binding protein [Spirochaetia bacterium]